MVYYCSEKTSGSARGLVEPDNSIVFFVSSKSPIAYRYRYRYRNVLEFDPDPDPDPDFDSRFR
jgi:ribosomal protein L24E